MNSFVKIKLDDTYYEMAMERYNSMPVYKLSHRGAPANLVGAIGEIVFEEALKRSGIPFEPLYTTQHDLLMFGTKTLEIKTKDRTVSPQAKFEVSLNAYNHEHQVADYYAFISLQRERGDEEDVQRFHTAWILGMANQRIVHGNKKLWKAGETDPSNGMTFWTDTWNLYVDQLVPFNVAIQKLKTQNA